MNDEAELPAQGAETLLSSGLQHMVAQEREIAFLRSELAAAKRQRDALKYEPNGQIRANLSNDAIQSMLDTAKGYMQERDDLKSKLEQARAALREIQPLVENALGDYHDTDELMKIKNITVHALAARAQGEPAKEKD